MTIRNITTASLIFSHLHYLYLFFSFSPTGTFPIDLTKTRLQVQGQSQYTEVRYRGMFHALFRIGKEEGIRALYSGYETDFTSHLFLWVVSLKKSLLLPPPLSQRVYLMSVTLPPKDFSCAAETSLLRHNQDRNLQFPEEAVRQPARRWVLIVALPSGVILCLLDWSNWFSMMLSSEKETDLFVLKAASQWKGFLSFRVEQHTLICQPLLCFYTSNMIRNWSQKQTHVSQNEMKMFKFAILSKLLCLFSFIICSEVSLSSGNEPFLTHSEHQWFLQETRVVFFMEIIAQNDVMKFSGKLVGPFNGWTPL